MVILVVEHDEDFRTALAEALHEAGHRVKAYNSPAEVPLKRLRAVDLVFSDYHLPGRTGIQFADAFHALYPRVPVVILTADPSRRIDAEVSRRPYMSLSRKPLGYSDVVNLTSSAAAAGIPRDEFAALIPTRAKRRPRPSPKTGTPARRPPRT